MQNAVTSQTSYAVICFLPSFLPWRWSPGAASRARPSPAQRSPADRALTGLPEPRHGWERPRPNALFWAGIPPKPQWHKADCVATPPLEPCGFSPRRLLFAFTFKGTFITQRWSCVLCSAFSSRENLSRNNLVLLFLCHKGSQHYHPHSISTRNYLSALSMQCLPQH